MAMVMASFLVQEHLKKETFCNDANLATPKKEPGVNCSSALFNKAPRCGETLRQKFATNRSDSSLCR